MGWIVLCKAVFNVTDVAIPPSHKSKAMVVPSVALVHNGICKPNVQGLHVQTLQLAWKAPRVAALYKRA